MNSDLDENACQEAYKIINYLLVAGEIVVPQDLLDTLEKKRNVNHKFDINDINIINLHPDTEKILTNIYIECLASKTDKNKIYKAIKSLKKVILNEESQNQVTSLKPISWSDKLRRNFWGLVKARI